jgi:hypothetical protein
LADLKKLTGKEFLGISFARNRVSSEKIGLAMRKAIGSPVERLLKKRECASRDIGVKIHSNDLQCLVDESLLSREQCGFVMSFRPAIAG